MLIHRTYTICLPALLLLAVSCASLDTKEVYINELPIKGMVKAGTHPITESLLQARFIGNVGNEYLTVIDFAGEYKFKVFDLESLEFLYKWGKRGRGPNEFENISANSFMVQGGQLEIVHNTFELISLRVTDSALVPVYREVLGLKGLSSPINGMRKLRDGLYFADIDMNDLSDAEYMVFNPASDSILFTFGEYGVSANQWAYPNQRYQQYIKSAVAKPDGDRIAAFYRFMNQFKLYDASGNLLKRVFIGGKSSTLSQETHYRIFAAATDEYIFTILLNKTMEELQQDMENMGPVIEIWNWEGEPVLAFQTDRPINSFAVDLERNRLISYSLTTSDSLLIIDIPPFPDK